MKLADILWSSYVAISDIICSHSGRLQSVSDICSQFRTCQFRTSALILGWWDCKPTQSRLRWVGRSDFLPALKMPLDLAILGHCRPPWAIVWYLEPLLAHAQSLLGPFSRVCTWRAIQLYTSAILSADHSCALFICHLTDISSSKATQLAGKRFVHVTLSP